MQSNVLVPARTVLISAVGLIELFVHGIDLMFGVTDVLLEDPNMLQHTVTVGAPLCFWGVTARVRIEGHFGRSGRKRLVLGMVVRGLRDVVVEYDTGLMKVTERPVLRIVDLYEDLGLS